MAERITGGESQVYISPANAAAQSILPAGLMGTIDSWSIEGKFTYEPHNEINNPRTVRQQTEQEFVTIVNGGVVDDTAFALMAGQSASFLNKQGTPKYHVRIVGNGTDGKFDRTTRWGTLDTDKIDAPAGNKTLTKALQWTCEDLI